MSKNNTPNNPHTNEIEDKPFFNILTKSKVQKLLKEQLSFTHGLLKDEKPVTGMLTVASVEETDEEEAHGESLLSCSSHLYYSLMLGALDTIISAMGEGGVLANYGLDSQQLASEMVDYLIQRINVALGIEDAEVEDFSDLVDSNPEVLDFLDNHFQSMIFVADED